MSKRKICFVMGSHWSAMMGGAQYQAKCILEELEKDSRNELVYLARVINESYQPDGYSVLQIGKAGSVGRAGFLFDMNTLYSQFQKLQPDIIYQRGLKAYTGVVGHYCQKNRCRGIFHVAHDYDVTPWFAGRTTSMQALFKYGEKKVGEYGLRRVQHIIAQTETQKLLLEKNYGLSPTAVVPNFHPLPKEDICKNPELKKIVWVANFKAMKRPELFVKLARELSSRQDAQFIMIGRPGDQDKYGELHNEIGNTNNLKYLGECSIERVNEELASAHMFVNTSLAEGFPNTFIQAWMRAVPVISMSVNIDSVFEKEKIGYFAENYEGVKDSVLQLLDDEPRRHMMGQRALRYAQRNHSVENAGNLLDLFNA